MKKSQSASLRQPFAFEDQSFLLSPACRGIRLELEYMKTALAMGVHNIASTITVFGGARILERNEAQKKLKIANANLKADPTSSAAILEVKQAKRAMEFAKYYDIAREFARLVSEFSLKHTENGYKFVITTGGGPGIMEAANRGAHDANAPTIGMNIELPHEEAPNQYITPELQFQFHYFSVRKMHLMSLTKAVICLPGGFGTFDELFEILTLIQNGNMPAIPIVIIGKSFWKNVINWQQLIDAGVISQNDLNHIKFCDTAAAAWNHIKKFYGI